jgi:hypothetical protein
LNFLPGSLACSYWTGNRSTRKTRGAAVQFHEEGSRAGDIRLAERSNIGPVMGRWKSGKRPIVIRRLEPNESRRVEFRQGTSRCIALTTPARLENGLGFLFGPQPDRENDHLLVSRLLAVRRERAPDTAVSRCVRTLIRGADYWRTHSPVAAASGAAIGTVGRTAGLDERNQQLVLATPH